ncbi:ATP-dependent endonuclease [Cohnella laeviribosi]|uniref:ATP-dependent endonuclease n=1 Tax=Cohnella laeviribosi TaxID=380174 RepID=UPI0012EC37F1|nr:ATP-dependent endonuclease [Cohnella laeviribosi]
MDVTKSDMLFAKGVILVEGIAEQLTMPVFAHYAGFDLESSHISVINIGSRYFKHFLKLFDSSRPYTLHKKVACITDLDPLRKKKNEDESKFEKCYSFELNLENDQYEYKSCSNDLLDETFPKNIRCFAQEIGKGKTFEYELAYSNPSCKLLLTKSVSNNKELNRLMDLYHNQEKLDEMIKVVSKKGAENLRIIESIKKYPGQDSRKHLIAARYLNSVDKGENAYELSKVLEENSMGHSPLISGNDPRQCVLFKVPKYIKDAISWICS